jgi:cellulose synthase/poly-beta-1,6-N-acetylglucosamine synthase-like glycosyltransferase
MIGYAWFVVGFFLAFIAMTLVVLILAAVEVHSYLARASASSLRRVRRSPLTPPISVLVPAYNEAAGIVDSVRSLLAMEYREFEVIVINDGSTDNTIERLTTAFGLRAVPRPTPPFLRHEPVRAVYVPASSLRLLVIDKENGGKADCLNAGINFAGYPIFCTLDADSILEPDALAKTVLPFVEDPERTVATGGMVRVANGCRIERGRIMEAHLPRSRMAMFQVVEYTRAFFGTRTGWSAINALLIVSGAFGLFRRDVVIMAGGYRTGTVGEDFELIVRLHRTCREARRPYRVVYVPDPVCWTEAPERARFLRRQRQRWYRGLLEVLFIHRRLLFNPRYGAVGMLAMPSFLLFEALGPVIELSGYAVTVALAVTGSINPATFVLLLLICVLYGQVLTLGSITVEDATPNRYPGWPALGRIRWYAWAENFGFRQLMQIWRITALWQMIRGTGWGAMERVGLSK